MATICYCSREYIEKIVGIYFHPKETLVWIIEPKYLYKL